MPATDESGSLRFEFKKELQCDLRDGVVKTAYSIHLVLKSLSV